VTERATVRDLVAARPATWPWVRRTESVPPAAGLAGWLPEAVPVAVAGFGIPAMALLLLGRFQVPLVVLAGTAGAVAAVAALGPQRLVSHRYGRSRWTAAALLLAAAFFGFNAWFATEDLYAMRDPSTYVATGQWLAHHPALPVDTEDAVFRAPTQAKLYGYSAGFGDELTQPGHVAAQGNHLLPALLAVASRFGGEATMLRLNAMVGAAALLAMFGLVRRFAGDPFALAAAAALAVSLPMLEFSRDAYTEPLALLLLFGGLSVLWRAVESGRLAEFALAGLTAGATVMSRIDGYLPLLALVAVGVGYAGRAPAGQRAAALRRLLVLVGGLALPAAFGYLDVTRLSSVYYRHSRHEILLSIKLLAVALAGGALLVAVCWLVRRSRLLVAGPPRAWAARLAVLVVPAFFAMLLARPLWLTSYETPRPELGGCTAMVMIVQQQDGLPVQPCRTYDEFAVYWLTWHFGWPALVLAVAGLTLLAFRTVRDADLRLLGITAITSAMCVVYLTRAMITPDQVWAMRRYLPVVLPGLLGAAGYLLSRLWDWQHPGGPRWVGRLARRAAVGLAVLLVAVPAFITHPMELVRQDTGQLGRIQALCRAVGESGAVLAVAETAAAPYLQTVRSTCGVPAHGLGVAPEPGRATFRSDLVAVRQAALAHGRPLYVITQEPDLVIWSGSGTPDPFYTLPLQRWPSHLDSVPQQAQDAELRLWVGLVLPDGTVRPVPAQG
jgi:hypothetical protein